MYYECLQRFSLLKPLIVVNDQTKVKEMCFYLKESEFKAYMQWGLPTRKMQEIKGGSGKELGKG